MSPARQPRHLIMVRFDPKLRARCLKGPTKMSSIFHPKRKRTVFFSSHWKKNTSLLQNKYCALFLSLSFCGSYFGFHTVYRMVKRVIHARLRLIPKVRIFWKSAGCGIICWNFGSLEYRNLLEYGLKWFEVYVENGDHCGRLDHRNHRIVHGHNSQVLFPAPFAQSFLQFSGGWVPWFSFTQSLEIDEPIHYTLMFGKVTKLQFSCRFLWIHIRSKLINKFSFIYTTPTENARLEPDSGPHKSKIKNHHAGVPCPPKKYLNTAPVMRHFNHPKLHQIPFSLLVPWLHRSTPEHTSTALTKRCCDTKPDLQVVWFPKLNFKVDPGNFTSLFTQKQVLNLK